MMMMICRPDALPVAKPTMSEKEKYHIPPDLLTPSLNGVSRGQLKLYTLAYTNTNPNTNRNTNPNPMRHCGRGSGCSQHYLYYDAKVYNSSLPSLDLVFDH